LNKPDHQVPSPIRPRDRDAILQSLRSGVVPRRGQQLIQVGRASELAALVSDIDRIIDGGSTIRFVIGEYGSGKTFFMMLVRSVALEKRLVTVNADLSPTRRFQGTAGQARSLYAELIHNLSTRAHPDGGALAGIVERFVTTAIEDAKLQSVTPDKVIAQRLSPLLEMVGGYDFSSVIQSYWRGFENHDDQLRADAVRWLRGEFSTKTEARVALGVRTIIDDANWYDYLKLLSRFVVTAGYAGMLVCADELVNLYKLTSPLARSANYEQLLGILNDSLQGTVSSLGWVFGGTPEFLLDTRRGLYSYQALQSRLAENTYAQPGLVDYSGPVLRLANLSPEDLYVLLTNLRHVFAGGDPKNYPLPDQALVAFMERASSRVGDAYFRTPRNTIKEFINLMSILEQNPLVDWTELMPRVHIAKDTPEPGSEQDQEPPSALAQHHPQPYQNPPPVHRPPISPSRGTEPDPSDNTTQSDPTSALPPSAHRTEIDELVDFQL